MRLLPGPESETGSDSYFDRALTGRLLEPREGTGGWRARGKAALRGQGGQDATARGAESPNRLTALPPTSLHQSGVPSWPGLAASGGPRSNLTMLDFV